MATRQQTSKSAARPAAPKRPAGTVISTPEFFKAQVGDSVTGVVTEKVPVKGKFKTTDRYVLETRDGRVWILGSDGDLNTKITRVVEKHGFGTRELYVELTPDTKNIGKPSPMKIWHVIDVTGGATVAKLPHGTSQTTLVPEDGAPDSAEDDQVPF